MQVLLCVTNFRTTAGLRLDSNSHELNHLEEGISMLVSPLSSFCRRLHRTAPAPTDEFLTEGRPRADRYGLARCTAHLETALFAERERRGTSNVAVQMAGAGSLLYSASTYPAILQVSAGTSCSRQTQIDCSCYCCLSLTGTRLRHRKSCLDASCAAAVDDGPMHEMTEVHRQCLCT